MHVLSKEMLLNAYEQFTVTVSFSPSVVGCVDAVLRLKLVGSAVRHSVSMIYDRLCFDFFHTNMIDAWIVNGKGSSENL